jgi:hypothetical protein
MKTREGIPEEDVDMMLEGEPFYSVLYFKKSMLFKGKYHEVLELFSKNYFSPNPSH